MLNLRITATGYKEKTNIRVQKRSTAPKEQISRPFWSRSHSRWIYPAGNPGNQLSGPANAHYLHRQTNPRQAQADFVAPCAEEKPVVSH